MQDLLTNEEPVNLHGYCPSQGDPGFRTDVAAHLTKTFGLPYEQKHIFPTTGAAGAIAHAIRAVTQPGDEVLTFAPVFSLKGLNGSPPPFVKFPEKLHKLQTVCVYIRTQKIDRQIERMTCDKKLRQMRSRRSHYSESMLPIWLITDAITPVASPSAADESKTNTSLSQPLTL